MQYMMIILSLFTADGIVKHHVEKGSIREKRKGKVVLKKYHNKGAMLNIGEKHQHTVAVLSVAFASFVTGVFVATLGKKGKVLLKTGLAFILGGAYSNTYDRLRRKYVVDYISFDLKAGNKLADRFKKIVFNISDFAIIIGSMFLVINEMLAD